MKNQWKRRFILFSLIFIFILNISTPVSAENLYSQKDTVIPKGQTVENVFVLGGDATISGTVKDAVVIVNGDLNIKGSARIEGLVLVIGGEINQEQGAHISEHVLNLSFNSMTANSFLLGGALLLGIWFLRLITSLLLIILSTATVAIAKERLQPFKEMIIENPLRLVTVGIVTSLLFLALSGLLSITIVGIPIVLVLLVVLFIFLLITFSSISLIIGEWLPGSINRARWMIALGGAILVTAGINLPLLGWLLFLGVIWMTFGLMTMWLWQKRMQRKV
ncbi:hypothetical protein TEPIDINF_002808 [Tepidibacillus infernus]|uniref:Polymer-forming cytoskeletal protein n=1 Tax=Tepidibacillus decaturensis TaxID=1413211 RepID=A0A135L0Q7_9BACI|nr:hypothetical protein [Tepidibacillus decaturensis]KXG42544.1 hypothetical protein U473_13775 [Tepidibacillus decaturensis]